MAIGDVWTALWGQDPKEEAEATDHGDDPDEVAKVVKRWVRLELGMQNKRIINWKFADPDTPYEELLAGARDLASKIWGDGEGAYVAENGDCYINRTAIADIQIMTYGPPVF